MEKTDTTKKPEYRKGEWDGMDAASFFKIIADMEKESDPVASKSFEKSSESLKDDMKRDPKYLDKLIKAQFTGFIVDRKG